ncbi:MAG: phosphodiester glycosidase family protein [Clostridia bacterium]|nr:phosphodiester glycosidase family protein [Clostridia bacterium]
MKKCSVFSRASLGLCMVLCLSVLLILCAGCGEQPVTPDPGIQTESETQDPGSRTESETEEKLEGLVLDESFVILRAAGTESSQAADTLQKAVSELFGFTPEIRMDKTPAGQVSALEEKAILVGPVLKETAVSDMEDLREKDCMYAVHGDSAVVIGGWDADTMQKAASAFLEDMYGYTGAGTGQKAGIALDSKRVIPEGSYPFDSLSFNGTKAGRLNIYYSGTDGKAAAALIRERITNLTGLMPRLVPITGEPESGTGIYLYGGVGKLDYSVERRDASVIIRAPGGYLKTVVNDFLTEYFTFSDTETKDLSVETSPLTRLAYVPNVKYDNGIRLVDRKDTVIKEGITYIELTYTNKGGKPVVAKAVIATYDAADVMIGSPKAQTSIDTVQTPLGQAKAMEEKWDVNVIAAANGDLFGYCYPLGPMYQNGVLIAEKHVNSDGTKAWTKHCFGIKKDGSYYIGTQVNSSLWYQLVGGEGIILRSGEIVEQINDQFFNENHPRTAIGYDKDKTLYLVEIDGRQSDISNGASFMDMALIFKYLGATDALNLDGGGSSVLYVENPETGELEIMTSPSDEGNEVRPCVNSILLIDRKK